MMIKLPFVSRKKYEAKVEAVNYWQTRAKFILNIPYMTLGGDIGTVQVYCEDQDQAEEIMGRLKGVGKRSE